MRDDHVIDQHDPQSPLLVRADAAEVLEDGPTSLITLLVDADATGGAVTANRATLRKGSPGAPPHRHTRAAGLFFVLDGTLQVLAGGDPHPGSRRLPGRPPNLPHAFAPAPGEEAEVLVAFAPGTERFDYYRLLERVYRGEADPREISESSERFDNHYVDSPVWRRRADRPTQAGR